MKILVIGSGAREHALAWKLRQCASVESVSCAPGNGGMAQTFECVPLKVDDVKAAADIAEKLGADLTIAGPEVPLVLGIADEFAKRGLVLLGPSSEAAQLEGSKIFAKEFLLRHSIPTAAVEGICGTREEANDIVGKMHGTTVIKADGLCAGKGVLVTDSQREAGQFVGRLMSGGEFGDAGKRVMFEEALSGLEISYIILTDGENFIAMAPTRDHKRAYDGDAGPNTGGMGAFSTESILPKEVETEIIERVVRPSLAGLRKDGIAYRGFLYLGLMLTAQGPKMLEYNCRLGDPETEVIVQRADFDLAKSCMQAARGKLDVTAAKWSSHASICVVVASEGYPEKPLLGRRIAGLKEAEAVQGATVFHAGTRAEGSELMTSGGRVLVVSARGASLQEARGIAYEAAGKIRIAGAFFRNDIGARRAVEERAAVSMKRSENTKGMESYDG